jgi:hypothetical protein
MDQRLRQMARAWPSHGLPALLKRLASKSHFRKMLAQRSVSQYRWTMVKTVDAWILCCSLMDQLLFVG